MDVSPLWDLRLRTPRLELRLPTEDELVALAEVAIRGIHPPDEMPFAVAWTDTVTVESFVEFHRSAWETWRPHDWSLNLVTFLDGRPIGTQGMVAEDFVTRREVATGSWLGTPFQRRGSGTEQRAAVLELAFSGLGAQAATSGAIVGNEASRRFSEKLGYRVTGMSTLSPRGEPVDHYDLRLERSEWRAPFAVEIEGLEPCLPLFGAEPNIDV